MYTTLIISALCALAYASPKYHARDSLLRIACPAVRCRMACPNGFAKDKNGCDTCTCKAQNTCPPVRCRMGCPNGWAKDDKGCDMCKCKATSTKKCPALCKNLCPFGRVIDSNGCPTCLCKGPQTERPIGKGPQTERSIANIRAEKCGPVCMIYCPNGNVLDARGCPTCRCQPGGVDDSRGMIAS